MALFFQPGDAVAADVIPFYWDGEYHLFYLKDYRDTERRGEGTPWFHLATRDFERFTDHGEALPRGSREEQDLYVFTGCVIERAGTFHIFYTGHNPHLMASGRPQEAVMHATSPDLVHWRKNPANPILFADASRYEPHDWRDPFVFWNEDAGEYWMLLAARLRDGPSNRRGCIALAASPDLVAWEIREPFWAPALYYTHECPDLFRADGWWYLVYSTFSERTVTHYRMSRELTGPWTAPANDAFDGRAFYAAKTAGDGRRRFAFGWNPSRVGDLDTGGWQWGGALVVHEVRQHADGALTVAAPPAVAAYWTAPVELTPVPERGDWTVAPDRLAVTAPDSFAWCRLGRLPAEGRLEVTITFEAATRGCGLLLAADDALDHYYQLRLEPGPQRLVVDRWPRPGDEPFMLERPLHLPAGTPVRLQLFRQDSVIVAYANDQVALSARAYDRSGDQWGLFVSEGSASFTMPRLCGPAAEFGSTPSPVPPAVAGASGTG